MRSSLSPAAMDLACAAVSACDAPDAPSATNNSRRRSTMVIKEGPASRGTQAPERDTKSGAALGYRLILLALVLGDEGAPRLRLDRARRLPHHVELAVGLHFADEHRLVQVMVLRVHRRREAARRLERLAGH